LPSTWHSIGDRSESGRLVLWEGSTGDWRGPRRLGPYRTILIILPAHLYLLFEWYVVYSWSIVRLPPSHTPSTLLRWSLRNGSFPHETLPALQLVPLPIFQHLLIFSTLGARCLQYTFVGLRLGRIGYPRSMYSFIHGSGTRMYTTHPSALGFFHRIPRCQQCRVATLPTKSSSSAPNMRNTSHHF